MRIVSKCEKCGYCCKNWVIKISIKDIKKIQKLGFKQEDFIDISKGFPQFKKNNNICIFLDKDNLCIIHKKYGYKNKADTCKIFPLDEFCCGTPVLTSEKRSEIKETQKDFFFILGKKLVEDENFMKLFKKINPNLPLFKAYYSLIFTILKQKDSVIFKDIKIRHSEPTKKIKKWLEEMLFEKSLNKFPKLNKFLNKEVEIKLTNKNFRFKFEEAEIPKEINKKFISCLKKQIIICSSDQYYPLKLLFILYFLPFFTKSTAKDKKIELIHVLQAFTMLNGLSRFGELLRLKKHHIIRLNSDLENLMKI